MLKNCHAQRFFESSTRVQVKAQNEELQAQLATLETEKCDLVSKLQACLDQLDYCTGARETSDNGFLRLGLRSLDVFLLCFITGKFVDTAQVPLTS